MGLAASKPAATSAPATEPASMLRRCWQLQGRGRADPGPADPGQADPGPADPGSEGSPRARQQLQLTDKKGVTRLCIAKGLNYVVPVLRTAGKILPQPGEGAAELLATVLKCCSQALDNQTNLTHLAHRCTDLLGLLASLKPAEGASEHMKQAHRNLVGRFMDKLREAECFCQSYTDKILLARVIGSGAHEREYTELMGSLDVMEQDVMLKLVVNLSVLTGEVHNGVNQTNTQLADKVIPDLNTIKEDLNTIRNKGFHHYIPQQHMQELWRLCCNGQEKVEWGTWWLFFPTDMKDILPDENEYQRLYALLEQPGAHNLFEAAVDRKDPHHISVSEVAKSFPVHKSVLTCVEELLSKVEFRSVPPTRTAAGPVAESGCADQPPVLADTQHIVKCSLPALDRMYCGRDAAAQHLCSLLTSQTSSVRAVLLLGGVALGKSSLALDVGWRLWRKHQLPGGAARVDLGGAATEEEQLLRICTALDVPQCDGNALLTRLSSLPPEDYLLLVLDNVEDCLAGASAAPFTQLVARLMSSSPALRLLITSRTAWFTASSLSPSVAPGEEASSAGVTQALTGYHEYQVPPWDVAALEELLKQHYEAVLAPAQLQPVLDACGGSPLVTRLVVDAVNNGRMRAEDVTPPAGRPPAADAAVQLVLKSLREPQKQQLAQLAVFPSSFNEEDAAAVLSCHPSQAQTLLHVLHTHSLLLYDSTCGQHYVYRAFRQPAMELATAQLLQAAREAFIRLMLGKLTEWAVLYRTKAFALALCLLRQQDANVSELWQLISECDLRQSTIKQVAVAMACDLRPLLEAAHQFPAALQAWRKLEQWLAALHAITLTYVADEVQTQAAESKLRAALEVQQHVLGPEHPYTISSCNKLADCLAAMGQHAEAERLYRTALEVQQQVLGPEHPDTISSSSALADCLAAMGRHAEAEPLYRAALEVRQRVLGTEHPDTISSISNLADCLAAMGQHAEAEPMYRFVLEVRQRVLGPEHPDTISSISNLADCLAAMGQHAEAEPMYRFVLEVRQRVLGPENPDTIISSSKLARLEAKQGQAAPAATVQAAGEDHASTSGGMSVTPASTLPGGKAGTTGQLVTPMEDPHIQYQDLAVGDLLGEGNFAEVHQGQWRRANGEQQAVAIKLLNASVSNDAKRELEEEASVWHALPPHPNVVQLFGWGINTTGTAFMVLELAPNGSLYHCLHQTTEGRQLTFEQRLHLARGAAAGLQHLHSHRVLHGNLTSANLLLADDGGGGLLVKVTDFGLSKSREKSYLPYTYKTLSQVGICAYASPEQFRQGADPVRVSSDVFALGTVLFEIFSGQEPWKDKYIPTIMMVVGAGTEEVVPLPGMNDLPAAVRQLVERCRCRDPQQRPTCQQVLDELLGITGLTNPEK